MQTGLLRGNSPDCIIKTTSSAFIRPNYFGTMAHLYYLPGDEGTLWENVVRKGKNELKEGILYRSRWDNAANF